MAPRSSSRSSGRRSSSRSGGAFLPFLGGVLATVLVAGGGWFYLQQEKHPKPHAGKTARPAASRDSEIPEYSELAATPNKPKAQAAPANPANPADSGDPPFGISEDVFEAGAHLYVAHCANCHGVPGHDVRPAASINATARQLWKKHAHGGIGVSAEPPRKIFLAIKDGTPVAGMPSYSLILTPTQIWQISLLLQSAGEPLPEPVRTILNANSIAVP
jgi:thiosulfate dehydrogenase